jgi:hypothetical protein
MSTHGHNRLVVSQFHLITPKYQKDRFPESDSSWLYQSGNLTIILQT